MENDSLYHFTTYDNFVSIIKSKKIFMFNAFSMKDTQEVIAGLEASILVVDDIISSIENNDTLINSFTVAKKNILKEIEKINKTDAILQDVFYFYILSLCRNIENEYLWDNYANNNTGVAIEFSKNEMEENISPYNDDFHPQVISWDTRDTIVPYLTGYINNLPLRPIHYSFNSYNELLKAELEQFKKEKHKDQNCATWIQLIIFNLSSSFKLISETDYAKEEETRFLFSLSHTGTSQDLTFYFNKFFYNIDDLKVNSRKYIPLHLNPLEKETWPLPFQKKHELIMSNCYPFAHIKRIVLGKHNKQLIHDIENFLHQSGFYNIEVIKMPN